MKSLLKSETPWITERYFDHRRIIRSDFTDSSDILYPRTRMRKPRTLGTISDSGVERFQMERLLSSRGVTENGSDVKTPLICVENADPGGVQSAWLPHFTGHQRWSLGDGVNTQEKKDSMKDLGEESCSQVSNAISDELFYRWRCEREKELDEVVLSRASAFSFRSGSQRKRTTEAKRRPNTAPTPQVVKRDWSISDQCLIVRRIELRQRERTRPTSPCSTRGIRPRTARTENSPRESSDSREEITTLKQEESNSSLNVQDFETGYSEVRSLASADESRDSWHSCLTGAKAAADQCDLGNDRKNSTSMENENGKERFRDGFVSDARLLMSIPPGDQQTTENTSPEINIGKEKEEKDFSVKEINGNGLENGDRANGNEVLLNIPEASFPNDRSGSADLKTEKSKSKMKKNGKKDSRRTITPGEFNTCDDHGLRRVDVKKRKSGTQKRVVHSSVKRNTPSSSSTSTEVKCSRRCSGPACRTKTLLSERHLATAVSSLTDEPKPDDSEEIDPTSENGVGVPESESESDRRRYSSLQKLELQLHKERILNRGTLPAVLTGVLQGQEQGQGQGQGQGQEVLAFRKALNAMESLKFDTEPGERDGRRKMDIFKHKNGRIAFSQRACRFELPIDMKLLEKISPQDYMRSFCRISARRQSLYKRTFLKYASTGGSIPRKDLLRVLSEILDDTVTGNDVTYICDLLQMSEKTGIDLELFGITAALAERLLYPQFVSQHTRYIQDYKKEEIEKADFSALVWKLEGIRIRPEVRRLIDAIR